jgi:CheY-like chemotaxis protein
MRPRKTILLVNANERQLGIERFMLEVRGYRVLVAQDGDAALALHARGVDLVLGFADGMLRAWASLAARMKDVRPEVPIVVVVSHVKTAEARFAVAPMAELVLDGAATSTAQLLEWVHLRIRRKSGPRRMPCVELVPAVAGD